jgi:hypothetical protein
LPLMEAHHHLAQKGARLAINLEEPFMERRITTISEVRSESQSCWWIDTSWTSFLTK